jgi:hypothetical protein
MFENGGMCIMDYKPEVSQGYYPEDAGWAQRQDGENVLLLCVPQYSYLITFQVNSYEYAWLYDEDIDGYIFCFKINKKFEQAFILLEEYANKPFTVAITHKEFATIGERDPVFMLKNIELKRNENDNW